MIELLSLLITSVTLFSATNIDDLVILSLLSLSAKGDGVRKNIVIGQYLGIGTLIAISIAAAFGLALLPQRWIGLLGFIPLTLGLIELTKAVKRKYGKGGNLHLKSMSALSIAGVTIANGADNLAVYTPLFHGLTATNIVVVILVFALLTGVWCFMAVRLATHKRLTLVIEKFDHWLVPTVFILIGITILLRSEEIARLI